MKTWSKLLIEKYWLSFYYSRFKIFSKIRTFQWRKRKTNQWFTDMWSLKIWGREYSSNELSNAKSKKQRKTSQMEVNYLSFPLWPRLFWMSLTKWRSKTKKLISQMFRKKCMWKFLNLKLTFSQKVISQVTYLSIFNWPKPLKM